MRHGVEKGLLDPWNSDLEGNQEMLEAKEKTARDLAKEILAAKAIEREKQSVYRLVGEFVETTAHNNCPTLWHWRGGWYIWTGTHYEHVSREVVEQRVLSFLKARPSSAVRSSTIRSILDLLRIMQFCEKTLAPCWLGEGKSPDPEELFVVNNGMLHISAQGGPILLPHDPAFFGLSAVEFEYCPSARVRRWTKFMDELWSGDAGVRSTLQEWFGYCLLPDTSQQKILAIIGPPRSGKSTIARVLRELIGPRSVACPSIRSLSGQFGLWGLLDKSVAIIPDATLPHPCPAVEELLKSISGEDAVDIHRKGMPPLTGVKLPTRFVVLANEMPSFHDPSGALDRRLIVLRTRRSFLGQEDVSLTDKLLEELPGILNWAIEGRKRLYSRGHFEIPEVPIDPDELMQGLPDHGRVRRIVIDYEGQSHPRRRRRKRTRHNPNTAFTRRKAK